MEEIGYVCGNGRAARRRDRMITICDGSVYVACLCVREFVVVHMEGG